MQFHTPYEGFGDLHGLPLCPCHQYSCLFLFAWISLLSLIIKNAKVVSSSEGITKCSAWAPAAGLLSNSVIHYFMK